MFMSIKLHVADSAPHAENTHFSSQSGVRAGYIESTQHLKNEE
jgi:hypothetical protein